MEDILNLLKRAGRRLNTNSFLDRLHVVAIGAAIVACLIALVTRGVPVVLETVSWSWLAPVIAMVCLGIAFLMWVNRRASPMHVAITVDERLSLREKISTAMVCRGRSDGFAQAAIDDAINVARDAKTRELLGRRFPIELPKRWWVSPALVGTAALITLLPTGDLFARDKDTRTPQERAEVQSIREQLDETTIEVAEKLGMEPEELKQLLENEKGDDLEGMGDREKLETPEEVRKEAFKDLSKMQEQVKQMLESEQAKSLEELANRLSQLDPAKDNSAASDLGKALKSGDFSEAKQALQKLQEQLKNGNLNEEQQKALAEQLKNMAQQLEQLAKQNQALQNALKQAGLDPNLANNPQALQQALQNAQNMNQQQKQQLQQMANQMQQAGQMCQGMAGAMQNMAGQMGMPGGMQPGQMPGGQMAGQLTQLEMMQQQMNQLQGQMQKLAGQCQKMGQGIGACQNPGIGQGAAMQLWLQQMNQMSNGRGPGMGNRGQGSGGVATKLAIQTNPNPDKVDVAKQQGPIIGETYIDSDGLIRGESAATFLEQVQTASRRSQEDLTENKISVKYEEAVKHFFGELEALAKSQAAETGGSTGSDQGASDDK